jgi:B-box zinc finger
MSNLLSCSSHQGEQAVLYCYTCESQCFCMECYLAGMHKNHDVKSVHKTFGQQETGVSRNCKLSEIVS